MISPSPIQNPDVPSFLAKSETTRRDAKSEEPGVFTNIYQEEINIAIWQRKVSVGVQKSAHHLLISNPTLQASMTVTPQSVLSSIAESLNEKNPSELSEDIAGLVDMFCCLFDLKCAGLRLTALNRAMCPKFHVDKVPCRLVTTYQGPATQWLPHQLVNRSKLGLGSGGQPDHHSGLFTSEYNIQQMSCGDVALLKGESWEGNENAGLVHRSPATRAGQNRLLLTLDFIN